MAVLINIETVDVNTESDGDEQLYTASCTWLIWKYKVFPHFGKF